MKKPEFNEKMLQRIEEIKMATYKYLQTLLEVDDKEMEALGLWEDKILQELSAYATHMLERKNMFICSPYIFEEFKIPYLCTLAECKCRKCTRQDAFMHKERMCAYIEDVLKGAGFSILEITEEGIVIREDNRKESFLIRITQKEDEADAKDGLQKRVHKNL
ncbi:MAG: hypothetical protein IKK03_05195 [Lachnospiraceae bacterium]|nr:hypothetical protein [Lachnospiraceae bacterium]